MDTQIWYAIFQTLYGGVVGAFDRLGEVILLISFFLPPLSPTVFLFPLPKLFTSSLKLCSHEFIDPVKIKLYDICSMIFCDKEHDTLAKSR